MPSGIDPIDQSSALGGGMALVPDWAKQELARKLGAAQTQNFAMQNAAAAEEIRKSQEETARKNAFDQRFHAVMLDPNPRAMAALVGEFPEFGKSTKDAFDSMGELERQDVLTRSGQVYAAANNGNFKLAGDIIKAQITADKAAGREADPTDAAILAAFESGDPVQQKGALAHVGIGLATATGGDHFAAATKALTEQNGDFTLGPGAKRYDKSGKVIAEAPFAPRPVTVGEGDTVIEYAPGTTGGGDQSSGGAAAPGDVWSRMIQQESGGKQFGADGKPLKSSKGALGAAQIMPGTMAEAARLAGEPADFTRLRTDRDYNLKLGKAYFDKQMQDFGGRADYAAAAYNAGPKRVLDAIKRAAAEGDVTGWQKYVPQETRDYVKRVAGGGGQSGGGGARVIAQGAPKQQTRILTPEEVSTIPGLDPNTVYQQTKEGTISAVGGTKAQLKSWPANALDTRKDIVAAIENVGPTLALLNPQNKTEEARSAQGAIGMGTGMLGNQFTNWRDPAGIDFRARIGQIGGIIIKDTSGAAVSLSEDVRLAKWVPLVTDTPSAARAKLGNLLRELKIRKKAQEDTYSEEQGFRSYNESAGIPVKVRSIQEAMKLAPGTKYQTPDGKKFTR